MLRRHQLWLRRLTADSPDGAQAALGSIESARISIHTPKATRPVTTTAKATRRLRAGQRLRRRVVNPATSTTAPTLAVTTPQFLTVNPSVPVKTVEEFVRYLKERPGKLSYGSIAIGSA